MRGNLEDAIGRGVNNRRASAHVLGSEFLDDLGAGGGAIPNRAAAGLLLEFGHDLRGKSVGKQREGLGEMYAHHLPMSGGCIFSRRSESAPTECGAGCRIGWKTGERLDVSQAETAHIGKSHGSLACDVAQRVTAGVAVCGGVGHLTDTYAVEYDPDDSAEHFSTVARDSETTFCYTTDGKRLIIEPLRPGRKRRIVDAAKRAMDAHESTFRRLAK